MFCNKCGMPIPEGSNVCPNCGTATNPGQEEYVIPNAQPDVGATTVLTPEMNQAWQQNAAPQEPAQPVYQEPVYQQPVYQQPVAPAQPAFNEASFSEPPKKKKKKSFLPVAIIAGVLALIAVLAVVFWPTVNGVIVRTFGSPEDYFRLVEKKAMSEATQEITAFYGNYIEMANASGAAGRLDLNVSDTLLNMIPQVQQMGIDLKWLDDLALEVEVGMGKQMMVKAALLVAQEKILDGEVIMDLKDEGQLFLALPMLNDKYLGGSMGMQPGAFDATMGPAAIVYDEAFWKAMPSEETLNALLTKYIDIALKQMEDVEKETETLEIGDVEQKVTVLEHKMTPKELLKIAEAILKEAKDDKEIKKVIEGMAGYLESKGMIPEGDFDAYEAFQEGVENALKSLKETEPDGENYLLWTVYVDSKSEVVGRKITVSDQEVMYYATATKGKNFATECKIGPDVEIEGDGTIEGDVRKGEYVVVAQGQEVAELKLEVNEKKTGDGNVEMALEVRPSEAIISQMNMDSQIASLFQSMDLGVGIKYSLQGQSGTIEINVVGNSGVLAGLSLTSAMKDVKVQIPDSSKVVDPENAQQWLSELDLNKAISAMEKAGIPEQIVQMAQMAVAQLVGGF